MAWFQISRGPFFTFETDFLDEFGQIFHSWVRWPREMAQNRSFQLWITFWHRKRVYASPSGTLKKWLLVENVSFAKRVKNGWKMDGFFACNSSKWPEWPENDESGLLSMKKQSPGTRRFLKSHLQVKASWQKWFLAQNGSKMGGFFAWYSSKWPEWPENDESEVLSLKNQSPG